MRGRGQGRGMGKGVGEQCKSDCFPIFRITGFAFSGLVNATTPLSACQKTVFFVFVIVFIRFAQGLCLKLPAVILVGLN